MKTVIITTFTHTHKHIHIYLKDLCRIDIDKHNQHRSQCFFLLQFDKRFNVFKSNLQTKIQCRMSFTYN